MRIITLGYPSAYLISYLPPSLPPSPSTSVTTKANTPFVAKTAPIRLLISLVLLAYTFIFSPSSPVYRDTTPARGRLAHPDASIHNPGYVPSGWGGDGLKNRVFFAFMFIEMAAWFGLWITLREERSEIVARNARKRGLQPQDLM